MASPSKLSSFQKRHKELFEEALLNQDAYRELGYISRDARSTIFELPLESLHSRLKKYMEKYRMQPECLSMLTYYCKHGGEFDYSLIPERLPKVSPQAKRDERIYRMWLEQGLKAKQIADELQAEGYVIDLQYVSKILKRKKAEDPNRSF